MSAPEVNIMAEFSSLLRSGPEALPGGGWRALYRLEPDFIGFSGHFPDYPLMPALMQVLMVSHMLDLALGRALKVETLLSAKFTGQARPGDELACLALPATASRDFGGLELWDARINIVCPGSEKNVSAIKLAFKA